ncbi:hypothetical protein [Bathymodiolus japonicus methanotrophic gill symbiont]|uniref:hypothetical protein n=1 Tax=Bathymodiolus japonicus methanotrophic gill symbiont TaxID=113269 RepID=UPI001C8E1941|nr:hypothetical protein [Bathymodiolus japonicus methanotrophic gill symbiont]
MEVLVCHFLYWFRMCTLIDAYVKKVDAKRLDDCIQSLHVLNMLDQPVHFICSLSLLLSGDQVIEVLDELKLFVQLVDRPVKTKEGWKKVFN